VGLHGLLQAVRAHPVILLAGFVGGFFETGVTSILPLYGLALGLNAAATTTLTAISGAGGMALMIPAGLAGQLRRPHRLVALARPAGNAVIRSCGGAGCAAVLAAQPTAVVP